MSGVVPDDVDAETLRKRIRQQSTTPTQDRKRCPECDSLSVSPRYRSDEYDWYCEACGAYSTDQEVRR